MRALVVDDSSSMRRLLAELLREFDYEVVTAGTGEDAIRLQKEEGFDLMLVDWTLPGLSGLDVCRTVRASPNGEDVVIVVITGRDQPEDLLSVLDSGASDYLAKPIDPDLLRTRLLVAARQAEAARLRRKGKAALLRAEDAFQRLVESAPDAVLVVDQKREVIYANPRMKEYLGGELVGTMVAELVHADDHATFRALHTDYLAKSQPSPPTELRLVRSDHSVVTTETVGIPLDFGGSSSFLYMARDLSERRAMQAQLLLADRMASVGTLAAGVAHELNNPLAYVVSNLSLTRESLDERLDRGQLEVIKAQVDEAIHGARRMGDIVRDLKTFSRGEDETTGVVDLRNVLASSINMCWNEIRHRARLEKYLGPVPPVQVNESRLGQVFLNLLINAAQAMPEADTSQNRIFVRAETDEHGWASVTIRDTGGGISAENLGRIFDPFFTTKHEGEGTGLGLAICRNIVTAAGGEIGVDSVVGDGTTFVVRFPPAEGKQVAKSARPAPKANGVRAKVLVVDDEKLVGRSIRRALRNHDVEVLSSGREAIEILCDGPAPPGHDIVFCDLMMPEVSGMDVFEAVKDRRPEVAERFVFMTGGAFTPRARAFLESMPNDCLEKPFDLQRIRELVQERAGSVSGSSS